MSIKLIIFDMAGTTVSDNSFVAVAMKKAFFKEGFEIDESDFKPLRGYAKKQAIQMILEKKNEEIDPAVIDRIHSYFKKELLEFYQNSPEVKPADNAETVFTEVRKLGIVIALNTGFSRDVANVIVNRFQWLTNGLIDDLIASNEVEKGRPWPNMINALMKRAGIVYPTDVLKVGDTVIDILEGRNAGCRYVVGITSGTTTREDLEKAKPSHIISDLMEVLAIIKGIN